ncbi:MAG TPA: outer membrane beta-barrel protein [Longimicrobiales bacterium]|nr:outer membrane beta-barrel protein [Longimicrobiales bacterium]
MKRSPTFLVLLTAFAAASAQNAHAQRIDSPYQFLDHSQFGGVWGGYVSTSEGRLDGGPRAGPIFGVNWALRVSGPFALFVDVGFMPTTRTVRDTTFEAADSMYTSLGEADISLLTAMGNLRFNLTGARTWHGFQPFVIVGAGMALDLASASAIEEDMQPNQRFDFGTSFAGQLGVGADWFPSPRVSIRVDARDMFWKLPVPEAFLFTENGARFPRSDWEQNFALAAGLSIHF